MPEHSGTHIDALSHQAENMTLHGGVPIDSRTQTSAGFREHGVEKMAPLIARGVLLDVAGADRLPPGRLISAEDLEATGADVREGDVALVRTGYGALWKEPEAYLKAAGVSAAGSRWLADRKVGAVGADNLAFDTVDSFDEDLKVNLPGHLILVVRAGIPIIENLNLEELAAAGVKEFAFICLPLKMRGVTGSPVRPIALA